MTLHEAIEKLLRKAKRSMTTQQIADELNKNGWYQKKDGSVIQAFQIHGRTKNYPKLFIRNGSSVSLTAQTAIKRPPPTPATDKLTNIKNTTNLLSGNNKTSFTPISNPDIRILILGSMPGDKSIELNEYYGHPQNRFWKIISTITNEALPLTYQEKKHLLLKNRIGVWDVAHTASREGSLDSAIKNEVPNDLESFIANHKNVSIIGFNGIKSETLFNKYFKRINGIKYLSLPSTSPANTTVGFDDLCNSWRQILV